MNIHELQGWKGSGRELLQLLSTIFTRLKDTLTLAKRSIQRLGPKTVKFVSEHNWLTNKLLALRWNYNNT